MCVILDKSTYIERITSIVSDATKFLPLVLFLPPVLLPAFFMDSLRSINPISVLSSNSDLFSQLITTPVLN